MKVTLLKNFGLNKKGETIEANDALFKHLLKKDCIKVEKPKSKK